MKAILSRAELVALIGKIQNVVPSKPSLPILANILIEAIDDQLIISATDLMVSMRAYIPAQVLEEGAIVLPARRVFQLVRELTAPQVEIHTLSPEVALINAGSSHFKVHGMHKSEFPSLPDLSEGVQLSLPTATLREMLSKTAFAAARDDSNPVINGVFLQNTDHTATFMSTDGRRMAKIHTAVTLPSDRLGSYIIPIKAVEEMIRMLDIKEEEETHLTLMGDKIALELDATTLISKLLSGQYPDIQRVIPDQAAHQVSLHREELISLLRQVSLFTSEKRLSVRFTFQPGELHLSAMTGEIGEGKVQMPVNYGGEKLEIAFHPAYFLDALRHSKDEAIQLSLSDSHSPGLITDSSTAQFVVMPMRLD